jgi:hypothetical protein
MDGQDGFALRLGNRRENLNTAEAVLFISIFIAPESYRDKEHDLAGGEEGRPEYFRR